MPDGIEVKRFTVVFAGGGTGGHLMPGLSVAEELRRTHPHTSRLLFVGTTNPLERFIREVRRRIRPMGAFVNAASCKRLVFGVMRDILQRGYGSGGASPNPKIEITQNS